MPTIHTYEKKIVVPQEIAITDLGLGFIESRKQAETAKEFKGKTLTNMPRLIELLKCEQIAKVIRQSFVDTNSPEFHTTIKGDSVYAVTHEDNTLTSSKRLQKGLTEGRAYGFIKTAPDETRKLFKNMVPIGDVRNGYDASNQTIAINLKTGYTLIPLKTDMKDVLEMYKAGKVIIFEPGQLREEQFIIDDRILAACGSKDNRAYLGEFLFKTEKKRSTVGSYHRIKEAPFKETIGRLVVLYLDYDGVGGSDYDLGDFGRSVGSSISAGGASARATSPNDVLEHRVKTALKNKESFEYEGAVYLRSSDVTLK